MISYSFNESLQILEVTYEGDICLDDLIDYGNQICSNEELPRNLKILADATKANYKVTPEDISIVAEYTEKQIEPYESVRAAFIQSKPVETALSHLVEHEINSKKYRHAVFSTRKAALNWLMRD